MNSFGSFMTTTNRKYNTWCKYNTRLDTYGCGCSHDCKYCYAKAILTPRKNWYPDYPRIAYITEIEKAILLLGKNEVIRIGGMTDCFQKCEMKERVTYETIKLFNKYHVNYLITTKSALVVSKEYLNLYDKELAHFQISISCTDNNKASEYENASSPIERIAAIEKLYEMSFDVSIRLSPFLYQYTDEKTLNNIKCNKILIEFLKINYWIKKDFNYDFTYHTLYYGGHQNLQLDHKINILKMVSNFQQCSVGEFVPEHYEYFRDNYNYNKNDCCNLSLKFSKEECEQTKIELFN